MPPSLLRPPRLPLLVLFVTLACGPPGVSAQTAPNQDVLAALLTEVRALRVAMEQMALAGPRIQIAFGRLQLQEQRVQTVIRRHQDVQDRLASAERQHSEISQQVELLKDELEQITNLEVRQNGERNLSVLTQRQKEAAAEVQRLRAQEVDLSQQVATEQNRWMEIERTLEDLERTLKR